MLTSDREQKIHTILRIAVAMCFIGHGAFGIITKPIWANYFGVFGISHDAAFHLMPVVGTLDILAGMVMLFYPLRIIPIWLVIWGIFTASLRPLSGEPFAEFIERAGNFGAPLALLLLHGRFAWNRKELFSPLRTLPADAETLNRVINCLRIVVFLLLAGHGWLNLIEKKGLLGQYTTLGFADPVTVAHSIGIFEILSALAILIRPFRPMLFGLLCWKIASEFFYPHYELFEWIERGGSYGALFALWLALDKTAAPAAQKNKIKTTAQAV